MPGIDSPAVADGALEPHRMSVVELRAGLDVDVTAAFGEFVDAGVVVLVAVIGFVHESRAKRALCSPMRSTKDRVRLDGEMVQGPGSARTSRGTFDHPPAPFDPARGSPARRC